MKRFLLTLLCCVTVGCGQADDANSVSNVPQNNAAAEAVPFPTHPKGHPVVLTRTAFDPTIADADRPTSPEAFVAEFEKRFAVNPEDAFVELTYWGDAPQGARYATLHEFLYGIYMKKGDAIPAITNLKLVAAEGYEHGFLPEADGRTLQPKPTHILEFETKRGNTGTSGAIALGAVDGRYYFCSAQ